MDVNKNQSKKLDWFCLLISERDYYIFHKMNPVLFFRSV